MGRFLNARDYITVTLCLLYFSMSAACIMSSSALICRSPNISLSNENTRGTNSTESEDPPTLMETLVVGQKRQRYAETAARQAEEEAESVRAESAAAQSELRKATARAASLATARIAADEKARKLREAADRLAAPKSD